MHFFDDRIRIAKYLYLLEAVLGVLAIAGAALYGAALSTRNFWPAFLPIFALCSVLWTLFCFGVYKGLTSDPLIFKIFFWGNVVFNVFVFPVGTAISGVSIWLWRELRAERISTSP